MFRNGLTAARSPLARSLSAITLPKPKRDAPFVCLPCQLQLRSIGTQKRRGRPPKKQPQPEEEEINMEQIKRLEAHVQQMQRNYADILKKDAATKGLPDRDITDEDTEAAYLELMAPPTTTAFLPAPPKPIAERLPPPVVERLGESLALVKTTEQPEWRTVLISLEANGGLEGMGTREVHKMLAIMELRQRALTSEKMFEMMAKAKIEPDTLVYDLVMLAHANLGHSAEVKTLFRDLKNANLKPTVYTYGHLLKAYSLEMDTAASAAAFKEMHAAGIEPNLVTYTTLIQTYVQAHELETAWQIFNLIKFKSTSTAPDVSTYTVMITACALNKEAERALDLHTDMTVRRGLTPTAKTYNALIYACAVRKDYFAQAWKFATDMQREGMQVDKITLNLLLQACGRTGELTRARLLIRHMLAADKKELQPDRFSYQGLLRSYATVQVGQTLLRGSVEGLPKNVLEGDDTVFVTTDANVDPRRAIPFLKKTSLKTKEAVLNEAALVVNWLRDTHPAMVDTQLLNGYLDVCVRQGGFKDMVWSYNNDFMNPSPSPSIDAFETATVGEGTAENPEILQAEPKSEPEPEPEPKTLDDVVKFERNIYTFQAALQGAVKQRKLKFARQVWEDRLAFTHTTKYWALDDALREKLDLKAEMLFIEALALGDELAEAAQRVEVLAEHHQWTWKELRTLYTKAVQLEDFELVKWIRKIVGFDDDRRDPEFQERYFADPDGRY